MPAGRRNFNRSGVGRSPPSIYATSDDAHKSKCGLQVDNISSKVIPPRHVALPSLPHESCLVFELIMFLYTGMSTFLQFLHIYRSVWWLPKSHTRYAMHFYLIDPYIVAFIATIVGRRLLYSLINNAVVRWAPLYLWVVIQQLVRLILLSLMSISLIWYTYNILLHHPIVNIFYLCYPLSVYFIIFGLNTSPFFDVVILPLVASEESKAAARILGKPLHSCSMSPQTIREEVEYLKTDFNTRIKQVLFNSVLDAYYAAFIPCCFAEKKIYYDVYWATQHLIFVWLGCFTMYLVYCYPIKYCDTLHRAALHLGKWLRVEGRSTHLPTHIWVDTTLWHHGALVRHCKELYKSEGTSNAAEPGNHAHARFYTFFNNPALLLCVVVTLQLLLVGLQLVALIQVTEWYRVVSMTLLLFANYYTLFKLSRDFFVCHMVYKEEMVYRQKITGG